jgi:thymidylate synthase (FAD)
MRVTLRSTTPLANVVEAIRICWDSGSKSDSIYLQSEFILGARDKALIDQVIVAGHTSTLEHLVYTFHIQDLPRFILQELARHRMASLSVKSSRYTLKELKTAAEFWNHRTDAYDFERASKYIYLSGIERLDKIAVRELENVRQCIADGMSNDEVKQILPECYLCDLVITINARSLTNLLDLRTSTRAHKLIQELAHRTHNEVPEQQKFIYNAVVKGSMDGLL